MRLKNLFSYVNILYIVLAIFTFIKMIYFTNLVYSEMRVPIAGSEFVWSNRFVLSYLFCAFSFFSIALIFNGKTSLKVLIGLDIFLSLFMFLNLIYFRSFESYLSVYNLAQYRNFGVVSESALALLKPRDIALFIDPIFLAVTYKFWEKLALKQRELNVRQRIIMAIYPIVCVGIVLNYNEFYATTITKIEAGAKYSIVGHYYYDISSYIEDIGDIETKKDVHLEVEEWLKNKNEKQGFASHFGEFEGKNVVFLQVESLENFVINLKVEGQEVTPNLNRLLNNSFYFDNIVSQENGGNSSDADFMANTSLLPLKSGSVSYRFPDNKYKSLPVILRKHDYTSHTIHSGQGYFWNKENFLPNLGFDTYTDIDGMDVKEEEMFFMGLKDKEHLSQVANKMKGLDDKFYLFTVTETSHTPFNLPEDMQYLNLSEELNDNIFGRYFQSIRYVDEAIGEFMDKLDEEGILDNTIFVIYGDHEGIHKYNNDSVLEKAYPDFEKYRNNKKIPLLIYSKDFDESATISKVGGHIDIMPTVLSLLGIEKSVYQDNTMGMNLLAEGVGYAIDRNGKIYGEVVDEDLRHVRRSIRISEKIIKTNYFAQDYLASLAFTFNGELKKLD